MYFLQSVLLLIAIIFVFILVAKALMIVAAYIGDKLGIGDFIMGLLNKKK